MRALSARAHPRPAHDIAPRVTRSLRISLSLSAVWLANPCSRARAPRHRVSRSAAAVPAPDTASYPKGPSMWILDILRSSHVCHDNDDDSALIAGRSQRNLFRITSAPDGGGLEDVWMCGYGWSQAVDVGVWFCGVWFCGVCGFVCVWFCGVWFWVCVVLGCVWFGGVWFWGVWFWVCVVLVCVVLCGFGGGFGVCVVLGVCGLGCVWFWGVCGFGVCGFGVCGFVVCCVFRQKAGLNLRGWEPN